MIKRRAWREMRNVIEVYEGKKNELLCEAHTTNTARNQTAQKKVKLLSNCESSWESHTEMIIIVIPIGCTPRMIETRWGKEGKNKVAGREAKEVKNDCKWKIPFLLFALFALKTTVRCKPVCVCYIPYMCGICIKILPTNVSTMDGKMKLKMMKERKRGASFAKDFSSLVCGSFAPLLLPPSAHRSK